MKSILIPAIFILLAFNINAQSAQDTTFSPTDTLNELLVEELEYADLSHLWAGSKSQDNRLGFIGPDFERLQLRFISVIKNPDNPFEYFLYGKTRVGGLVCEFQGSLNITEAGFFEDQGDQKFKRGFLTGDYVLFEDPGCMHSGVFRGTFLSSYYTDDTWTFYYNDLQDNIPAFNNNQFQGYWVSYSDGEEAVGNWGDFRIPASGELDAGFAAFLPSVKYLENGWKDYELEVRKKKNGEVLPEWWK